MLTGSSAPTCPLLQTADHSWLCAFIKTPRRGVPTGCQAIETAHAIQWSTSEYRSKHGRFSLEIGSLERPQGLVELRFVAQKIGAWLHTRLASTLLYICRKTRSKAALSRVDRNGSGTRWQLTGTSGEEVAPARAYCTDACCHVLRSGHNRLFRNSLKIA